MNESAPFSEPDKLDTDELTPPVAPAEKSVSSDENATGLIEVSPGTQETAIITAALGDSETSLIDHVPVMKAAKRCHVGAVRDRNEDSCLVFVSDAGGHFALMPFGLYIVADGMGGHANGHVASKIASRTAAHKIIDKIYLPLLQEEGSSYQPAIQEVMTEAVHSANTAVYTIEPENDSGTTLTIALILGRRLYIAHVGDSRIYQFCDEELEIVSKDHSLVQRLQEVGQLSAEEATFYQYRHVLLRAVGQTEEVEVDTYMRRLPKKGRLLLCSDGLPTMLSDEQIREFLAKNKPAEETADLLLNAALEAGGYDNITVILVDFAL